MLRAIVGVIASYIVMGIIITVLFFGGFLVLGVDRFFQPDIYEVSTLWLTISFLISLGSAIVGGYICAAISHSMKACKVLALIVLVLGILLCLPKMREDPVNRAGDVPTLQVAQLAQMPAWAHVLTPVLGAIGVLLGARMKKAL
jgi:NADH:ubiquinone oxidoreductase subunit H